MDQNDIYPQQPIVQQPVEQPQYEAPVVQEPVLQEPIVQEPAYQPPVYQQPVAQQPNLLVFGILSLALNSVLASIVGIILGAIGRKKGKEYIAQGGTLTGTSKVGFILCKAGFIVSIVCTALITVYCLIVLLALVYRNT